MTPLMNDFNQLGLSLRPSQLARRMGWHPHRVKQLVREYWAEYPAGLHVPEGREGVCGTVVIAFGYRQGGRWIGHNYYFIPPCELHRLGMDVPDVPIHADVSDLPIRRHHIEGAWELRDERLEQYLEPLGYRDACPTQHVYANWRRLRERWLATNEWWDRSIKPIVISVSDRRSFLLFPRERLRLYVKWAGVSSYDLNILHPSPKFPGDV